MKTPLAFLASFALTPQLLAQTVWTVDDSGGADFTSIQAAVDAAGQGDTILMALGTYGGFTIDNKSLHIVSDVSTVRPLLNGPAQVTNTGQQREVLISGLDFRAGVEVEDCAGEVLFIDCRMLVPGEVIPTIHQPCWRLELTSHEVRDSYSVTFVDCLIQGRKGRDSTSGFSEGSDGEDALHVESSDANLYGCNVRGGHGGSHPGGGFGCDTYGADGGHGIIGSGTARVYLERTAPSGGTGFLGDCFGDGCDGAGLLLRDAANDRISNHPASACLEAPVVTRQDQGWDLELFGDPGNGAFLILSAEPQLRWLGTFTGLLHTRSPIAVTGLGSVPGNGRVNHQVTFPPLVGLDSETVYAQGFLVANGARFLTNPRAVVVLDPAF